MDGISAKCVAIYSVDRFVWRVESCHLFNKQQAGVCDEHVEKRFSRGIAVFDFKPASVGARLKSAAHRVFCTTTGWL
ncbi:hypothetical protein B2M27_16455 [Kluyvera intermedia]|uniref:Uncharacterized protein n=1 Tax=Kluyvera intermedia TaxID=61648 RepID=A0ABX3UDE0_KLUIN|nr:hypothetical protein B2M27_16455 [Kluyvera intermedia]